MTEPFELLELKRLYECVKEDQERLHDDNERLNKLVNKWDASMVLSSRQTEALIHRLSSKQQEGLSSVDLMDLKCSLEKLRVIREKTAQLCSRLANAEQSIRCTTEMSGGGRCPISADDLFQAFEMNGHVGSGDNSSNPVPPQISPLLKSDFANFDPLAPSNGDLVQVATQDIVSAESQNYAAAEGTTNTFSDGNHGDDNCESEELLSPTYAIPAGKPEPLLLSDAGGAVEVLFSHMLSPSEVWLQLAHHNADEITEQLNVYYRKNRNTSLRAVKPGVYCGAPFPTDMSADAVVRYYRALVLRLDENGYCQWALVKYIDYANEQWVSVDTLRSMEDVSGCPVHHSWQSFACSIQGLIPVDGCLWAFDEAAELQRCIRDFESQAAAFKITIKCKPKRSLTGFPVHEASFGVYLPEEKQPLDLKEVLVSRGFAARSKQDGQSLFGHTEGVEYFWMEQKLLPSREAPIEPEHWQFYGCNASSFDSSERMPVDSGFADPMYDDWGDGPEASSSQREVVTERQEELASLSQSVKKALSLPRIESLIRAHVNEQGLFECFLTHVESPLEFWLQFKDTEAALEHFEDGMYHFYQEEDHCRLLELGIPYPGTLVVTRKEASNGRVRFIRGVIEKELVGEVVPTICVRHVDYGETEDVRMDMVYILEDSFACRPPFAAKCALAGVPTSAVREKQKLMELCPMDKCMQGKLQAGSLHMLSLVSPSACPTIPVYLAVEDTFQDTVNQRLGASPLERL